VNEGPREPVCHVFAQPDFPGKTGVLIEVNGEDPVPPLCPLMVITSAPALATPAAMMPTPERKRVSRRCGRADHGAQVVDQLSEIFDAVNVVMRRRRNQRGACVACRMRAMYSLTFLAGNWPPSPGFEPCAILISSSSAWTR